MGQFARNIQYAGDLFLPTQKYMQLTGGVGDVSLKVLVTLADLLVLHDKVYLRADTLTISELLNSMSVDDLRIILESNRIGFYRPVFKRGHHTEENYEQVIVQNLQALKGTLFEEHLNINKATQLIFDNILPSRTDETIEAFKSKMNALFYENEFIRSQKLHMDVHIGFREGIDRIRELWKSGISSVNYDWEFHHYLDICSKAAFFKQKNLEVTQVDPDKSIIDDLHKFRNIPSLALLLAESERPTKLFLDLINSNETGDFRRWIQTIDLENADIRDAYEADVRLLPSKNKWTDWIRFGSVSIVSTILGSVLTSNPYLGFLIGTGVSSVDKIYGEKAIDTSSSKYNPEAWISFIESNAR